MASDTRVRRAREGDAAALRDLLADCRPSVVRFIAAMIGDAHEAEDVFQTTAEAVQKGIGAFEGKCAFTTWVYQIALNQARRILRDRARHAKAADPETLDRAKAARKGVLSSIYRRELSSNIEHSIDDLPPSLKEAFVLHYLEGLDFGRIAEIAGVTANTMHVRAHRARALLRDSLGPVVDTYWREPRAKGKSD